MTFANIEKTAKEAKGKKEKRKNKRTPEILFVRYQSTAFRQSCPLISILFASGRKPGAKP